MSQIIKLPRTSFKALRAGPTSNMNEKTDWQAVKRDDGFRVGCKDYTLQPARSTHPTKERCWKSEGGPPKRLAGKNPEGTTLARRSFGGYLH